MSPAGAQHQDRQTDGPSVAMWLGLEVVDFRDASLLGSRGIELRDSAVKGDLEEMARKELICEMKTSCVILCYSETVINPLLGYD
jgi:hypothetical protein